MLSLPGECAKAYLEMKRRGGFGAYAPDLFPKHLRFDVPDSREYCMSEQMTKGDGTHDKDFNCQAHLACSTKQATRANAELNTTCLPVNFRTCVRVQVCQVVENMACVKR